MGDLTQYYWTPSSGVSIDDFLKKYTPSILDQGDAPWIWIGTSDARVDPEAETGAQTEAVAKGAVVLDETYKRLIEIGKDPNIPVRGKKGGLNKKQAREEAQQKAADALKDISLETGYTHGKWMSFSRPENVDAIWARVAKSVAYGPLHDLGVTTAKVATRDPEAGTMGTHVVIIYVDNVYDKDMMTKVLVSLLEDHGIEASACKSDLYTALRIDSKHSSGVRSSIWRPTELVMNVKVLKDKYRPWNEKKWGRKDEAAKAKRKRPGAASPKEQGGKSGSKEPSPELKKEVSFSDKVEVQHQHSPAKQNGRPAKRPKSAAAMFKENDIFAADSEEE
ncbi:hypothetical protein CC85DRAFT_329208 [Cutaneotrichosporon oleaginosum]|uniref:DUF1917-domain-containing protein n=1 Tax=Cutaneotrichosporon oleaginosum TaxID=879819 RepID=A0A0J0XJD2_9TREE|nr:uncharacterized protein CC85DRAFT_329208 [Cutaneotrichosporon oleaginosum]KLT41215.1 hypothetical protein CC85DRAFT_329208 [Cutaneotrichosporon oleaginosum]TXT05481.1 hypothetical protein COLE_06801 [Cutaneotrichosporon oleaginosum]